MTDLIDQALEDDFDSPDFEDIADDDFGYLDSMWKGHKFGSTSLAEDLVTAHGMVQGFVNAFARDGRYTVNFDEGTSTAGTDMSANRVTITPAPVADKKLSVEQIGRILTGLAVHEVSHTRYGRRTFEAVRKAFPNNRVAARISNVLDDIRIERRFVSDYPGYAGIFEPTLDYVGGAGLKDGELVPTSLSEPTNLLVSATRYPKFAAWTPETEVERAWWNAWADRWAKEDAPIRHVAAIREALAHIVDIAAKPEPKQKAGSDEQGGNSGSQDSDEQADEEPTSGAAAGADEQDGEAPQDEAQGASGMTDDELSAESQKAATDEIGNELPDESGSKGVERAAREEGASRADIKDLKDSAEQIIENARNIEGNGHEDETVDVARSLKGLTSGRSRIGTSAQAVRYIANAIMRSRTGNQAITPFKKHGRLDNAGLYRVALGASNVFEKRVAPSPGKYLVWLMVDCSGSMGDWGGFRGPIEEASQVSHAIAAASLSVPSVRVGVWGWSSPFRNSTARAGVVKVWETGGDLDDIFRMKGLQLGGTPDSVVTSWAARAIKRAARPDEQPVLIIASDGSGYPDMNERVEEAREMGVHVYSVSFGMDEDDQLARFGRGNYVPFAGSIAKTAKPLADLFARITSGRGNQR